MPGEKLYVRVLLSIILHLIISLMLMVGLTLLEISEMNMKHYLEKEQGH